MFAFLAAAFAFVGYYLDGSGGNTSAWLSPSAIAFVCIGLIALHLARVNGPK